MRKRRRRRAVVHKQNVQKDIYRAVLSLHLDDDGDGGEEESRAHFFRGAKTTMQCVHRTRSSQLHWNGRKTKRTSEREMLNGKHDRMR